MAFTVTDVDKLKTEVTGAGGVLEKINALATATTPEAKKAAIIPLIGALINLVITAIKAAID